MKLFIAALLSAALFILVPHSQSTPVHNLGHKAAEARQAQTVTNSQKVEPKAEVAQVAAAPVPPAPVQPEQVAIPEPPRPSTHEELMAAAGISPADYGAVDYIVSHESSWCPLRWNGDHRSCEEIAANPGYAGMGSGAYGMCQSLGPNKMASEGEDYMTNAVTQLRWCSKYAHQRYTNWWRSFAFWQSNKWW